MEIRIFSKNLNFYIDFCPLASISPKKRLIFLLNSPKAPKISETKKSGNPVIEVKNTVSWTYVINDPNGEEIIGTFYEKEQQKTNQQEFRIEKVIRKKMINCMSNGKAMIVHLIAGLIKKT